MQLGTTELDAAFESEGSIESYSDVGVWDTMKASYDNFRSVSLSTSELNHYKDQRDANEATWIAENPAEEELYKEVSGMGKVLLEKLDTLYAEGNIEAIKNNTYSSTSEAYLRFREVQSARGLTNTSDTTTVANETALREYKESGQILKDSDHWFAEMAGTMGGALTDPVTLLTLPFGTWKTGGTVLQNAGRALLEEMKIEATAQAFIAPTVYSFKKELGIKTSIATEATNAVLSIGGAGLVRGVGSGAFDLTAKGLKALKAKDPELATQYEALSRNQPTEDLDTHAQNQQAVEFGGEVTEIINPNEVGRKLNEAEPIVEYSEDLRLPEIETTQADEMLFVSGKDMEGKPEFKSYKAVKDELDVEAEHYRRIEECLL